MLVLNCLLEMEDQRQASWRCVCLWKTIQGDPWECVLTARAGKHWNFSNFSSLPSWQGEGHHSQPWVTTGGGTAWEMGFIHHSRATPKKKPHHSRPVDYFTETAINFLKSKLQQLPEALPSPEPLGLQGLGAAHCHSVHGEIQKLFKCYNLCCIST